MCYWRQKKKMLLLLSLIAPFRFRSFYLSLQRLFLLNHNVCLLLMTLFIPSHVNLWREQLQVVHFFFLFASCSLGEPFATSASILSLTADLYQAKRCIPVPPNNTPNKREMRIFTPPPPHTTPTVCFFFSFCFSSFTNVIHVPEIQSSLYWSGQ